MAAFVMVARWLAGFDGESFEDVIAHGLNIVPSIFAQTDAGNPACATPLPKSSQGRAAVARPKGRGL